MPWLLRTIVDLFNTLSAWYYRRKYGAAAKQLGRPPFEKDGRRGFVILEIDGLAHGYLREALGQGAMPYLARLIRSRRLRLARWRCGLPSTTPASQAGILYGNNWDIPGFRWFEKETGESVVTKLPGWARAVQERVSAGRAGLLRGGSSYTNMFDGGARLALFTLAALGRDRLFENVRGAGFLILFALSPWHVIRVIALSFWTWIAYVAERAISPLSRRGSRFTLLGPLYQIANNIIFREITTFSVKLDIYRGMPCLYAAYTGYDEIAHHFGADSREAFRALRGIDRQIHQIDRIRQIYIRREYDLFILSDHGMTPSVPFRQAYGETLQHLIATQTGREVSAGEEGTERSPQAQIEFLLEEVRGLEARSQGPLPAQLLRAARQRLEQRLRARTQAEAWDLRRRREIVVRNSGSLSHLYFNVSKKPMDFTEVMALYPGLTGSLAGHPGIGLVVGREGDEVVLDGQAGTLWIGPQGRRLEGANPLSSLPDPEWAADQIVRLARFPHSGDLILLGAWEGERLVSFEEQIASHGGVGGLQTQPFLAYTTRERHLGRGIDSADQIYSRLAALYGAYE